MYMDFVVAIPDVHAAKYVCDILTVSVNVEQNSIVKHMSFTLHLVLQSVRIKASCIHNLFCARLEFTETSLAAL